MPELWSLDSLYALLALTGLEIVLGVDNIVFIAILTGRLPEKSRPLARRLGIGLALISRLALLLALSWTMGLVEPWFSLAGHGFSGRDIVMLGGGVFLVVKATHEIFVHTEGGGHEAAAPSPGRGAFGLVVGQIMVLDVIFSLDSVITAVGMAQHVQVMAAAIIIAVAIMLFAANAVAGFIERHPSFKVLGLSFLLLVGVFLTAEGLGKHVERGYIYTAMAFSLLVELIHLRAGSRRAGA